MKKILWLVFAVLIVLLSQALLDKLALNDGVLTVESDGRADGTIILAWTGPIRHPMATDIAAAYRKHGGNGERIVLTLNSGGGSVEHGNRVIRTIQRIKRTHQFDTAVEGRELCASMCVPVYLQGQNRFASPQSRWLFHEVSVHDAVSGERQEMSLRERRAKTNSFFLTYFPPAGVPIEWLRSIRPAVERGDVRKRGHELVAEGSNIITQMQR